MTEDERMDCWMRMSRELKRVLRASMDMMRKLKLP